MRSAHYEGRKVVGLAHAITGRSRSVVVLDDVSLVRKVESELFRHRSIPKGQISINSDRGIVVMRGALEDERQIRRIGHAARRIAGVRHVENLLHVPGAPAPPSQPHGSQRSPRFAA